MTTKTVLLSLVCIILVAAIGIAVMAVIQDDQMKSADDVVIVDLIEGSGPPCKIGSKVSVFYRGSLVSGEQFDSNIGRAPFTLTIGGLPPVIQGWTEGLPGMKVGGKRRLTIPPAKAYGAMGSGEKIPPNSTLVFEIELVNVE